MKYSEGDWTTIGTTIFLNNDYRRVVAQAFDPDKPQHTTPTAEANAHLVKAAPAMYEALKECVVAMTLDEECDHDVGICWCSYKNARFRAQHALASAEGKGE